MKFLKDFDHVNSVFAECNVIECGRQNGSRSLLFGLLRATLQEYAADSSDTGR